MAHPERHRAAPVGLEFAAWSCRWSGLETYEVRAGNQLIDMFQGCYWAIAFCFLFKHASAEPDVINTVKAQDDGGGEVTLSRRKKGNPQAPEVDIQAWGAAMLRQASSHRSQVHS